MMRRMRGLEVGERTSGLGLLGRVGELRSDSGTRIRKQREVGVGGSDCCACCARGAASRVGRERVEMSSLELRTAGSCGRLLCARGELSGGSEAQQGARGPGAQLGASPKAAWRKT